MEFNFYKLSDGVILFGPFKETKDSHFYLVYEKSGNHFDNPKTWWYLKITSKRYAEFLKGKKIPISEVIPKSIEKLVQLLLDIYWA